MLETAGNVHSAYAICFEFSRRYAIRYSRHIIFYATLMLPPRCLILIEYYIANTYTVYFTPCHGDAAAAMRCFFSIAALCCHTDYFVPPMIALRRWRYALRRYHAMPLSLSGAMLAALRYFSTPLADFVAIDDAIISMIAHEYGFADAFFHFRLLFRCRHVTPALFTHVTMPFFLRY